MDADSDPADSGYQTNASDSGYQSNQRSDAYRPPYASANIDPETDSHLRGLHVLQGSVSDGVLPPIVVLNPDHNPPQRASELTFATDGKLPPLSHNQGSVIIPGSQSSFARTQTVLSYSPGSSPVSLSQQQYPTQTTVSFSSIPSPMDFSQQSLPVNFTPPNFPVTTNQTAIPVNPLRTRSPIRNDFDNMQWYPNLADKQDEHFLKWGSGCSASLSFIDHGYELSDHDMRGTWATEKFPDHAQFWSPRAAKFGTRAKLTPAEVREADHMFIQDNIDMRGAWTTEKFPDHNHDGESFDQDVMRRGTRATLLTPAEVREIDHSHPDDAEMEDVLLYWSPVPMLQNVTWAPGQPHPVAQSGWPSSQPQSLMPNTTTWVWSADTMPNITSTDWQTPHGHHYGPSPCCCNSCGDQMDFQFEETTYRYPFTIGFGQRPAFMDGGKPTFYDHSIKKWRKGNITGDTMKEVDDQVEAVTEMTVTVDEELERKRKEDAEMAKPRTKIIMIPSTQGGRLEKEVRFTQNTGGRDNVHFSNGKGNGNGKFRGKGAGNSNSDVKAKGKAKGKNGRNNNHINTPVMIIQPNTTKKSGKHGRGRR